MKKNPQGIDVLNPRFSWQIFSDMIDLKQVSYHIQVAS
jgi:alpha-L-rhamnosidase